MRQRYIQDPVTLKLVPVDEYFGPGVQAPMVIGDIQPYQSMATGEMIMGRRQHREHLRQHRLVEVGNEIQRPSQTRSDGRLRQTLVDVVRAKM